MTKDRLIVFFDGDCGFCMFWVRFILNRDSKGDFYFAKLQGSLALQMRLTPKDTIGLDTIYFVVGQKVFNRSDACCEIARRLPWPWSMLGWLAVVPKVLRDWIYDRIAQNRFRMSGVARFCKLPTDQERLRFLD